MELENCLGELPKLVGFVGRFAVDNRFSVTMLHDLNLVLEELFVNIVEHGSDAKDQPIRVDLERRGDDVIAAVADHAAPFNPLQHGFNASGSPLERRSVGGLGLRLVRGLADEIAYSRVGDANVTTVKLRVRS